MKCLCGAKIELMTLIWRGDDAIQKAGVYHRKKKPCIACGREIISPRDMDMKMHFDGPLQVLEKERTRLRDAFEISEDVGGDEAYVCEEVDVWDEPSLISDLLFATRVGMSKMIDLLIPLTVRICQQVEEYDLLSDVHTALMKMNCKVACQWAAFAFEHSPN